MWWWVGFCSRSAAEADSGARRRRDGQREGAAAAAAGAGGGAGGGRVPRVRHGAAEGELQREGPLQGALLRRRHHPRLLFTNHVPLPIHVLHGEGFPHC